MVTSLTGAVDVQHRTSHVVIANLKCPFSVIGHVAIGAGHSRSCMNTLAPHFKLRVLNLEDLGSGTFVYPIVVPILFGLVPRIENDIELAKVAGSNTFACPAPENCRGFSRSALHKNPKW